MAGKKSSKSSKSAEAQAKVVRGRRGSLQNLPAMPLDILVEIMAHLRPLDILNLSRTNKEFRKFLMARTSAFIWKRAREHVDDFPPCPDDLSEPAYANLAFDTHCNVCLAPNAQWISWELRVRYCKQCRKDRFLPMDKLRTRCGLDYHMSDYRARDLFPSLSLDNRRWSGTGYHVPDVENYLKNSSRGSSTKDDSAQEDQSDDEDLRDAPKWKKRPEMRRRLKHAKLCAIWQEKSKNDRKEELQTLRERRHTEIITRLQVLGWSEELTYLYKSKRDDIDNHPRVNEAKELTDRAWNKLLPTLLEILEDVREKHNREKRLEVLTKRLHHFIEFYASWRRTQGPNAVLPQAIDFTHHIELQEIITGDLSDSELDFETLRDFLPAWADEWRNNCDMSLTTASGAPSRTPGNDSSPDLASAIWTCSSCKTNDVLHYPEVLEHRCLYQPVWRHQLEPYTQANEWDFLPEYVISRKPWSCKFLVTLNMRTWASDVIRACGMDPKSVTKKEMDELDVRLDCKTCIKENEKSPVDARKIFNWRAAVQHYYDHFRSRLQLNSETECKLSWQRAQKAHLPSVKRIEERAADYYRGSEKANIMCCAYCPAGRMDEDRAISHMDLQHSSILDDSEPGYYRDKSLGPAKDSPVLLILKPRSLSALKKLQSDPESHEVSDWTVEEAIEWVSDGRADFF